MLRISKKADYAVFLLGAIARQGAYPGGAAGDSVVSAHEIAKLAGLNKSVVANLLKEFARRNLLESVRGLRGGYRLVKPPSAISLGEILEVVEGPFTLVDCVEHTLDGKSSGLLPLARSADHPAHDCQLIGFCPSKNPMRIVHQRIADLFHRIRLDELCSLADATPTAARR
ncbi:MAG: Rrf2 family transcriptional regulator [Planctomycetes bacterium]|nr:Rrf2 family transcriptional regulator [Planctomycetota bacterium]